MAEVKRRSPSRGTINAELDAAAQGRAYREGGARAISVLTEGRNFGGSPEDLQQVGAAVDLPLLKKDFHVDPLQVLEARALGASGILLIARALAPDELRRLSAFAIEVGVEPVIEVRDDRELDAALATAAPIIGVNARNLETLAVDPEVCATLLPKVPRDRVAVYESGIRSHQDVETAAKIGADAVLVGSAVSEAESPATAVRSLIGVPRSARG